MIGSDKPDEPGSEMATPDSLQCDLECLDGKGNDDDNDETSADLHQPSLMQGS